MFDFKFGFYAKFSLYSNSEVYRSASRSGYQRGDVWNCFALIRSWGYCSWTGPASPYSTLQRCRY